MSGSSPSPNYTYAGSNQMPRYVGSDCICTRPRKVLIPNHSLSHTRISAEALTVPDRPPSVVAAEVIGFQNDNSSRITPKGSSDSNSRVSHDPPAARMPRTTQQQPPHRSNEASFLPGDYERAETGNVLPEETEDKEEEEPPTTVPTEPSSAFQDPSSGPSKKYKMYAIIGLSVVVLVGALLGGICGSGLCSGSSRSSSVDEKPIVTDTRDPSPTTPSPITPSPVAPVMVSPVTTSPVAAPLPMTKLEQLTAAGQVSCGVLDLPGQSKVSSNGEERVGFSVDLVRACGMQSVSNYFSVPGHCGGLVWNE